MRSKIDDHRVLWNKSARETHGALLRLANPIKSHTCPVSECPRIVLLNATSQPPTDWRYGEDSRGFSEHTQVLYMPGEGIQ